VGADWFFVSFDTTPASSTQSDNVNTSLHQQKSKELRCQHCQTE